jgi:arylsulfatase A-like enzyme
VVSSVVLKIADPLHTGFDAFDSRLPAKEQVRWWVHERTAAATTDAALAMLGRLRDGSGAPTFLWVHYQDPHGPYTPPPGERERFLEIAGRASDAERELELTSAAGVGGLPKYQFIAPHRDVAFYRAGYAGEIHSADAEIGRLLDAVDAIDEKGDHGPAAVIFTADHGEDLGEGDHWFAHGSRLGEPVLRVPLLIRAPGVAPGVRADPATLLDVLPTVAGLDGLAPSPEWSGRDLLVAGEAKAPPLLLVTGESEDLPSDRGIVHDGYKLVQTRSPENVTRVYRLPDESADLSAEHPERLRSLSRALEEGFAELSAPIPEPRMELAPEDLEGLRAMGYVEDSELP